MSAIVLKWLVMLGMAVARIVLSKLIRIREKPIAIINCRELDAGGILRFILSTWLGDFH
jgi:hypothetical protein